MEEEVIELLFEEFGEDAEVIADDYDLNEFDTARQAVNCITIREEWRSQPIMDRVVCEKSAEQKPSRFQGLAVRCACPFRPDLRDLFDLSWSL